MGFHLLSTPMRPYIYEAVLFVAIEVDAPIAGRTPHRTVREAFPHTAPYKSDTSVIIRRH